MSVAIPIPPASSTASLPSSQETVPHADWSGALPGLISKVWLADATSNTFRSVYTWQDRAAYEAYMRSELFKAVGSHPNLSNVTSRGFEVMEELTRQTRGLAARTVAA